MELVKRGHNPEHWCAVRTAPPRSVFTAGCAVARHLVHRM